jgi:c-di-GMP-binding flagellar brake protein YcgR
MSHAAVPDRLRASRRVPVAVEARVRLPQDANWVPFETRDVSAAGAFLSSQLLFDVGTRCAVEIPLPDGSRFRGHAQVVRLDWGSSRTSAGMGLEFLHVPDLDRRRLKRVLGS